MPAGLRLRLDAPVTPLGCGVGGQSPGHRVRLLPIGLAAAIALVGLTLSRGIRAPVPAAAGTPATVVPKPAVSSEISDRSVVGTLDRVDTASRQITVATRSGRLLFDVQSGATVRQGSKTLKPSDLAGHKGERVKVRYRERDGERRADWIVVAAAPRRPARGGI